MNWAPLLIVALFPRSSQACSPPTPGLHGRSTWPLSGATDVPTNARILVRYDGDRSGNGNGSDIELRRRGGGALKATITLQPGFPTPLRRGFLFLIVPETPLLPAMVYEVWDRQQLGCDAGPCGPAPAPQAFASFTTGAEPDVTRPVFAGPAVLTNESASACNHGGCCGYYTGWSFSIKWAEGSDDGGVPPRYHIYDLGTESGRRGEPVTSFVYGNESRGFMPCTGGSDPFSWSGTAGPYTLRAVDLAGHEVEIPVTGQVTGTCPIPRDGGADASPDTWDAEPGKIDGGHDLATEPHDASAASDPRPDGADAPSPDAGTTTTPDAGMFAPPQLPERGCAFAASRVNGRGLGGPASSVGAAVLLLLLVNRRRNVKGPRE